MFCLCVVVYMSPQIPGQKPDNCNPRRVWALCSEKYACRWSGLAADLLAWAFQPQGGRGWALLAKNITPGGDSLITQCIHLSPSLFFLYTYIYIAYECECIFSISLAMQVSLQIWAEETSKRQSMSTAHFWSKQQKWQLDETASVIQHCTRPLNKSLAATGHRWH